MVSRLLNAVLYTLSGEHNHSTVFLSRNRAMGLHSDSHNHQDVPNVLIPLSVFSGGQLFVESEEGDACLDHQGKVRGFIYPITLPFLSFDAQKRHSILPWSGCRLILGSFHIRGAARLPPGTRNVLRSLGYSIRQDDKDCSKDIVPAQSSGLSRSLLRPGGLPVSCTAGPWGNRRFLLNSAAPMSSET